MSLVETAKLSSNYTAVVERLAADDDAGLMRPSVSARLVQDVSVESRFDQYDQSYTFHGDEAHSRGGHERGPSPMRYFLSGIAFCLVGWYAKGSAFTDVELQGLDIDIRTFLDMRGEHGFDGVPAHPQWLELDIQATSPSAPDNVLAMIDWGDERCPLGVFARRAVPVYQRVTHNRRVIRDTIPPEAQ